jgi:hypothetical protein
MDYDVWIERERRIRVKILNSSPIIQKEHKYRVCKSCGEICLCHEESCPNCNSTFITNQRLEIRDGFNIASKIRCQYRFNYLNEIAKVR